MSTSVAVRTWGRATTRLAELALAVAGIAHVVLGGERSIDEAVFLLCWAALASAYLLIGAARIRRHPDRADADESVPRQLAAIRGERFSFVFTVAASLTGLSAALDVLQGVGGEVGAAIEGLSVVVVICAWLLLHIGYARFYQAWDSAPNRSGFGFPGTAQPAFVDYLYFAITIGVSFAASDVTVRDRSLRWHVIVHSVASFLYNAIVLAVGVGVLTGR